MPANKIKKLTELSDLDSMRVILRLDLNVPLKDGYVTDGFRIERIMPTLDFLKARKAKTLIVSHIESGDKSLKPVFEYLKGWQKTEFAANLSEAAAKMKDLKPGEFLLLENIRREKGEEENDPALAEGIAKLGDIYVNEAFPVSHRKHASVVGVPKLIPGYAGLIFIEEIEKLSEAFAPNHPACFILGGAKFETKLPLVSKFLKIYDHVFIGGALANDIFKAQGLMIGQSTTSGGELNLDGILKSEKLYLPFDVLVDNVSGPVVKKLNDIRSDDKIVDSGPKTGEELFRLVSNSKFVLWNGPLGMYEGGFSERTEELAKIIVESGVKSVIGGGDTVAAAEKTGLLHKFSFVSTGGGAMLDFLAEGTLPGIEALKGSL